MEARKLKAVDGTIDLHTLENRVTELATKYQNASPFPHIVLDNFLHPSIANAAFETFPTLRQMDALNDMRQSKAQDPNLSKFPEVFRKIVFESLHSARFLKFVSDLTGIEQLTCDPQLYAAGLAQGGNGSFLNVHVDNSSHPTQPWYRRVNILIYLNKNWNEQKGGHIEFWDDKMKSCQAILPAFNRAVLFTVSPTSWHGYRRVVTPDNDTRKSINLYYFTEASPTGKPYHHVTSFRARPGEGRNRFLYPIDNFLRTFYRRIRRKKDSHAVLYDEKKKP